MMKGFLMVAAVMAAALCSAPASGQAVIVSPPPTDIVTRSDMLAEVSSATATAVAAAKPPACPMPLADTVVGSAGVGAVCTPRADNTRPTVIQGKNTTTLSNATWSVTWDRPFASQPIYADARVIGATDPYLCTITSFDANGANGKCFQLVATTLPNVVTSLVGLTVSPFAAAGANLSVRVVARQ